MSVLLSLLLALSSSGGLAQMPAGGTSKLVSAAEARTPPAWLDSAVVYEIFPRSFSAEGNFGGITAQLDRLQRLGVNVLWLMPINPVGEQQKKGTAGSPYAVRDYYAINEAYGSKADLHRLIDEAHRRQMRVVIDIVANHTAWDSVMMAHPSFYKRDAQGKVLSPHDWNDVAALDYTNPELRQYMIHMLLYWANDFHLDGFRCDAAGELPTDFWEEARQALDRAHPGLLLLAEASKPELMRSAFDLDYAWPEMATLNEVLEHGRPASAIEQGILEQERLFPRHALHMRLFDDHDEQRALARYGIGGSLAAAALILTSDGVPMIYNGMEVSDPTESGAPALFETLKIFWQAGDMRPEFGRFYGFMIPYRKQQPALRHGETVWVHNSDEAHVVTYLRRTETEEFLVAINFSGTPFRGTAEATSDAAWAEVEVPQAARRGNTGEASGRGLAEALPRPVALPALSLDAFQFRLFHRARFKWPAPQGHTDRKTE